MTIRGRSWLVVCASLLQCAVAAAPPGWRSAAPLPEPRWFHRGAWGSDGRLYALGGKVQVADWWVEARGEQAIVRLAPDRDGSERWLRGPEPAIPVGRRLALESYPICCDHPGSFPSWREEPRRAFEDGREAAIGPADVSGRIVQLPLVLDPSVADAWSLAPGAPHYLRGGEYLYGDLPAFRRSNYTVAVSPDGRIYHIGGMVDESVQPPAVSRPIRGPRRSWLSDSVESYDLATGAWRMHAPLRTARQLAAAAFGADGRLYVFGGYGGMGSMEVPEQAFADPRGLEGIRDELNALAARSLDSVEVYDPRTDRWEPRASLPVGVENAGAALGADGRIYVVGGARSFADPKSFPDVWVYDPGEDAWYEGPPLRQPRYGHAVVGDPEGRIWVSGGFDAPEPGLAGALRHLGGGSSQPLASVEVLDTRPFAADGFRFPGRQRNDPRDALATHAAQLASADGAERTRACRALVRIVLPSDAPLVAPLARATADGDTPLRVCALAALARMEEGARSALSVVGAQLEDDVPAVRWAAVEATLRIAPEAERARALPALLRFLRDDDREERLRSMRLLGRIGAPAVVPLRAALADRDHPFPDAVIESLEALGSVAAPALLAALHDPHPHDLQPPAEKLPLGTPRWAREVAASSLLRLAPEIPEHAPALARGLDDPLEGVRWRVAIALARAGERARPALLAALDHARWDVRCAAAWALGELVREEESVRALRALVDRDDADPRIVWLHQRAACEALSRLGAERPTACDTLRRAAPSGKRAGGSKRIRPGRE